MFTLPGGIEPTQLGTAVPSSTNKVPKESDQSNSNYTAAIIGGVTGGIAGLVILNTVAMPQAYT